MPGNSPENLLESVVHITQQRDRDTLEVSLINTLQALTAARRIGLYQYQDNHAGHKLHLLVETRGGQADGGEKDNGCAPMGEPSLFDDCLAAGSRVSAPCGASCPPGCQRHIYPITGKHGITGFLEVYTRHINKTHERLIDGFLQIYRNYIEILDESEHDTLTGLLNRKTFDRNIARVITRRHKTDDDGAAHPNRRHDTDDAEYWLAVADIDHFKRINDHFGHLYGYEVLLLLAHIMKQVFRRSDKLYRFGGEEFVIVLELAKEADAKKTFERFRQTVEDYPFPQVGKVTISLGFTRIRPEDITSEVIGHADEALYYAKHHGRNQIHLYETLIAAGKLRHRVKTGDVELF